MASPNLTNLCLNSKIIWFIPKHRGTCKTLLFSKKLHHLLILAVIPDLVTNSLKALTFLLVRYTTKLINICANCLISS